VRDTHTVLQNSLGGLGDSALSNPEPNLDWRYGLLAKKKRKRYRKSLNAKNYKSETAFEKWLVSQGVLNGYERNWPLINSFFGDFVWIKQKLVIEIDGSSHDGKESYDLWRDSKIQADGWVVVRLKYPFINNELLSFSSKYIQVLRLYSDARKHAKKLQRKLKRQNINVKNPQNNRFASQLLDLARRKEQFKNIFSAKRKAAKRCFK